MSIIAKSGGFRRITRWWRRTTRKRVPSSRKKWASDNNANVARADWLIVGPRASRPLSPTFPHTGDVGATLVVRPVRTHWNRATTRAAPTAGNVGGRRNGGPHPAGSRPGENERPARFLAAT